MLYNSTKIEACIQIEISTAEIYHAFAKRFPGARQFWEAIAREEENHALVLIAARRYNAAGRMTGFFAPLSMDMIKETLDGVKGARKRLEDEGLTMRDALETALMLEESVVESYFKDAFSSEPDSEVISVLKKLLLDSKRHAEKITGLMDELGIPHKAFNPLLPGISPETK